MRVFLRCSSTASLHGFFVIRLRSPCSSQADLGFLTLADDKILVDLGAKPDDGSSPDEFGNGLREVIHDIRSRKIRDFNIVAGEITAYRAKFLGDSSKVLPL